MAASGPYGLRETAEERESALRKGSVRAARERLQTGQTQNTAPERARGIGLPGRPNQLASQYSGQSRLPSQETDAPDPLSPNPQWPLPNDGQSRVPGPRQQPVGRGPPPQRPPRPVSDDLPLQHPSPQSLRPVYQNDDPLSPMDGATSSRPLTTSSSGSFSSLGEIPDFPVPQPPMPVVQQSFRRNPSLGPPPSARRGPSSYYTQMSYVSPIAEESETRSDTIRSLHGSFASSNVIPTNVNNYYEDDGIQFESDDEAASPLSDDGPGSRASDHDERSNLVRQASLGRRTKPLLMTIKSGDSKESVKPAPSIKRKPVGDKESAVGKVVGGGGAMVVPREQPSLNSLRHSPNPSGSLGSGTALLDPSSSSSSSFSSLKPSNSKFGTGPPGSDTSRSIDMEKDDIQISIHPLHPTSRQSSLADRIGVRRPPKIDVDAAREAEDRSSVTSLPDLIKRATRLAANLDRGKTASRLGLDFWESGGPNKPNGRRSGSLSDMLAAFPPPGEATPTGDKTPNKRDSRWPSASGYHTSNSNRDDEKAQRRRRRCCGMPMWTFVTLLIVLLFLVAAAVIIPIVLIVIPRMREANNDSASAPNTTGGRNNDPSPSVPTIPSQPGVCDGIIRCQNGGVAVPNADGSCNCVCINGFTGRTCGTRADAGCTTTNIDGTANNATVGAAIPRLLRSAESNFSIPLDSSRLLSIFSDLSLSCTAENALVTFNGLSSRSVDELVVPLTIKSILEPTAPIPQLQNPHLNLFPREFDRRQTIGGPGTVPPATITAGSAPLATPTASLTPIPSVPISSNSTAIDFARVVVLLVLQESRDMNSAAGAQESIQNFLNNNRRNGNTGVTTVDLGNDFTVDLAALNLDLGNGTTIQATPSIPA